VHRFGWKRFTCENLRQLDGVVNLTNENDDLVKFEVVHKVHQFLDLFVAR